MQNRFGTTSDMIIQTVEENGVPYCLAIDEKGLYLTTSDRLDKMLADPNRYTGSRRTASSRLAALGLDPAALAGANQHLIKKDFGEPAKKINPLKASKRAMRSA